MTDGTADTLRELPFHLLLALLQITLLSSSGSLLTYRLFPTWIVSRELQGQASLGTLPKAGAPPASGTFPAGQRRGKASTKELDLLDTGNYL